MRETLFREALKISWTGYRYASNPAVQVGNWKIYTSYGFEVNAPAISMRQSLEHYFSFSRSNSIS